MDVTGTHIRNLTDNMFNLVDYGSVKTPGN